ncbi:MAG: SAM hydroxide adenosyltransferase, partial [Gemmatimonadaceae bacterium]
VSLAVPAGAAPTLHGRDVVAPAAALLATGARVESLGPPHASPVLRRTPEARRRADGAVEGEVIAVDRFGNLVTNLVAPRGGSVEIAGRSLGPVARTYADAASDEPLAVVGSSGLIEVAVRDGSAARLFSAVRGTPVLLYPAH